MSPDLDILRHRRKGQYAVRLELDGQFDLAGKAWCDVAASSPRLRWKEFAERRARECLNRLRGRPH